MSLQIGPYVVSRGAIVPYSHKFKTDQIKMKDGDGNAVVIPSPYTELYIRAVIRVPHSEGMAIGGYLAYNVGFSGSPLTLVDGFGTSYLVRFWDDEVQYKFLLGGILVELDLLFRKEI